jgi:stearoyl-CoA desaturase (Delta-9 desaturase)
MRSRGNIHFVLALETGRSNLDRRRWSGCDRAIVSLLVLHQGLEKLFPVASCAPAAEALALDRAVPMGFLLNKPYKEAGKFRWHAVIGLAVFHAMALLGLTAFRHEWIHDSPLIWTQSILMVLIGISSTAGAHRCFVHQAYEAALPLQIFYMTFVVAGMTGSPIGWIRSHRTHHKYSDTDMDPHNSHLGFWHSHFGWLCWEPSKKIQEERQKQELGTLQYLGMHKAVDKVYDPVGVVVTFFLPWAALTLTGNPVSWWGLFWTTWMRLALGLNMAASVNSLAHTFGTRPYNPYIEARNNFLVSVFTWGEGWHNYHHAFPKDYRASAHDNFLRYWNPAHAFILLCAKLGLAYNLKVGCDPDDPDKSITISGFNYKILYPRDTAQVCITVATHLACATLSRAGWPNAEACRSRQFRHQPESESGADFGVWYVCRQAEGRKRHDARPGQSYESCLRCIGHGRLLNFSSPSTAPTEPTLDLVLYSRCTDHQLNLTGDLSRNARHFL